MIQLLKGQLFKSKVQEGFHKSIISQALWLFIENYFVFSMTLSLKGQLFKTKVQEGFHKSIVSQALWSQFIKY